MGRHVIDFTLQLITKSEANARDHWRVKARRVQEQRAVLKMAVAARLDSTPSPRWRVTITRAKRGRPMDDDNLRSACKGPRDGIADALGIDDGDPRVTWEYKQVVGKGGSLRVQIERVP
jgi:hypothetical protein